MNKKNYAVSNRDEFSLFDPFFDDFFGITPREMHRGDLMKADIREEDDRFVIDIDVPALKKENIKLELNDGYLTIRANQSYEHEEGEKKGKYLRRERFSGSYSRSFYVGEDVTNDDISAKLENGTLSIDIKKVEEKKQPKTYIEIK